jgi:hypothetical protein
VPEAGRGSVRGWGELDVEMDTKVAPPLSMRRPLESTLRRSPGRAISASLPGPHCRSEVSPDAPGTGHRDHCPSCLWSRHLDDERPGDRASECGGSTELMLMRLAVQPLAKPPFPLEWLSRL